MPLLTFVDAGTSESGKTRRFIVQNERTFPLGNIQWMPSWRRYVFCPSNSTVFDASCLSEIIGKLNELMQERKQAHGV
jgi:hypothetical protein